MFRTFACFVVALCLLPVAAVPGQGPKTKSVAVTVAKADPQSSQIYVTTPKGGVQIAFKVDDKSMLLVDGSAVKFNDIKPGYKGTLTYIESGSVIVMLDLESGKPAPQPKDLLRGTVESVGKSELVVNRAGDGKEFTLAMNKNTKILVDGVSGTLKDLKRGQKVDVFIAENSTLAVRILVYVKDTPPELK